MDENYLKRVREKLQDGEEILWTGKAEKGRIMTRLYTPVYLRNILISYGFFGFIAVICVLDNIKSGQPVDLIPPLLMLAFGSVVPLAGIADAVRAHKLQYAATDRRLFSLGREAVNSVPYVSIHEALLKQDSDGFTSLLCGSAGTRMKESRWRTYATMNNTTISEDQNCEYFILYAVNDPEGLRKALKGRLNV